MTKLVFDLDSIKDFEPDPHLLLCPNVLPPLHGLNPRTILGTEWWDEARKKAYGKWNSRCWACGICDVRLSAHEIYYHDFGLFQVTLESIVALCKMCHDFIHSGRQEMLRDDGRISPEQYRTTRDHGLLIVEDAGLVWEYKHRHERFRGDYITETWGKWHLLLEGEKYYSSSMSPKAWRHFYSSINNE